MILPIKKKWYDMILSGKKKEEYREIKPYYISRFEDWIVKGGKQIVMFRNGYSSNSPSFLAMCSIGVGLGKEDWGAEPGKLYYVLTIEEIL